VKIFLFLLKGVSILACCLLVSCAGTGGNSAYSLIVNEEVALNESGPYQTTPAYIILKPGMRVRLLSKTGSHVYVETVSGERGFVPTASLQAQGDL
jgi:hypothetical protein